MYIGIEDAIGRTNGQSSEIEKYTPHSRKYRIGIFGSRAAKRGKKSWRKTSRTTGAKFRSKIPSPSKNFRILPIWFEVPGWHSASAEVALCRVQSAIPALRNITPLVGKVSPHDFPV